MSPLGNININSASLNLPAEPTIVLSVNSNINLNFNNKNCLTYKQRNLGQFHNCGSFKSCQYNLFFTLIGPSQL